VVSLSEGDLADLTQLRVKLECMAMEQSIANGGVHWEAEVVAAHHVLERAPLSVGAPQGEEWIGAHAGFHDALGAGCGSPRLIAIVHSLRDGAEVYRQWAGTVVSAQHRDIVAEHRQLMEFATARKPEEAAAALARHIQLTTDALLEAQRQAPGV
jgi:DNA-binding GntR family transcriptional regulator